MSDQLSRPIQSNHWQRRLDYLAKKYDVPGATLGILRVNQNYDDVAVVAYGRLSRKTGIRTTPDSLFQIGSITKLWTATLAMQLVDQGQLHLDEPLVEVMPELELADPAVTKQLTMRHLLTHTSGIDGDGFTETGRGDDCLERYVASLAGASLTHPLGATLSYCNAGFSLAGRVIERLTGSTWDEALEERLIRPLGLENTVTLAEHAILHRAAVGHLQRSEGIAVPAKHWTFPRSTGPAGLICASVNDVLTFARLQLTGGLAANGARILETESTSAMINQAVPVPDTTYDASLGLGWQQYDWNGRLVVGHDGMTIGQQAYLRVVPDANFAVALLTNRSLSENLYEALFREIFAEETDVIMPSPLTPPADDFIVDASSHVGRYERASVRYDVRQVDGHLQMELTMTGPHVAWGMQDAPRIFDLVPYDQSGNVFVFAYPPVNVYVGVVFYRLPTGESYMHSGLRATPKTA